jgi:HD-like signal output (HDOD) protein
VPDRTQPAGIEACLGQILQRNDFPAFAAHIQAVLVKAQDPEASLRQVTNAILKDMGLVLRVLRTANSPLYNRSGRPIHTVAHALALVGLEAVRDMALSLLLLRHFEARVPGARQLMLLSLLSAHHGRETAVRVDYPRCEEAYLCAMFRNLGEVLVSCYRPPDYAAILLEMRARKCAARAACQEILGFTYEDLGRAAAECWGLPEKIVRTIGESPADLRPLTELDWLLALTNFSHDLTMAIHRLEPEGARARVGLLMRNYSATLGLGIDDIQEIARTAIAEAKATFDVLRIPMDDLRLRRVTEDALECFGAEPAGTGETHEPPKEPTGLDLAERIGQDIEEQIASGRFDLNGILMMALEGMYRGIGFDRVLFCLAGPGGADIRARLGLGNGVDELIEAFLFPVSRRNPPVAAAMIHRTDLLVYDGRYEDTEFGKVVRAPFFGLYPVVTAGVAVGCFYFDRREPSPPLEPRAMANLRRLRDLSATALALARR